MRMDLAGIEPGRVKDVKNYGHHQRRRIWCDDHEVLCVCVCVCVCVCE
jgi:hypothetical protein